MAEPLPIEDANEFTEPVLAPGDGEEADQAVFSRALQALANRTRWLLNRLPAAGLPELSEDYDPEYGTVTVDLDQYSGAIIHNVTGALTLQLENVRDGLEGSLLIHSDNANSMVTVTAPEGWTVLQDIEGQSNGAAVEAMWLKFRTVTFAGDTPTVMVTRLFKDEYP